MLVWDNTNECLIIDPGCSTSSEEQALSQFIESKNLTPVRLINTHCHIDHVYGNGYVANKWNLQLEIHKLDLPVLERLDVVAMMYGLPAPNPSPAPGRFLEKGDVVAFGNSTLEVLFVPGHCPGHIALYSAQHKLVVQGDVLFYGGGRGRTDLPGGDEEALIRTISEIMFALPDDTRVICGHGPETTIGYEKNIWQGVRL